MLLTAAAQQRRVILLLDALNQMAPTPAAWSCVWLPDKLPANVRLFATSTPPEHAAQNHPAQNLKDRLRAEDKTIPPLQRDDAAALLDKVCRLVGKTLHSRVRDALLAASHAGNPLWLTLAVDMLVNLTWEELRREDEAEPFCSIKDAGEKRAAFLTAVAGELAQDDVPALYQRLLARVEKRAGRDFAAAFAVSVGLSRYGLRDSDLKALLAPVLPGGWDDIRYERGRHAYRAHLIEFRSRLAADPASHRVDFLHLQLRAAVRLRYAPDSATELAVHRRLADHLQELDLIDPQRQRDSLHHLVQADDPTGAAAEYAQLLKARVANDSTRTLADHICRHGQPGLDWVLSLLRQPVDSEKQWEIAKAFIFDLHNQFVNENASKIRRDLLEAAATWCERNDRQRDLSVSLNNLGDLELGEGQAKPARQYYERSLAICEELVRLLPQDVQAKRDLSVSLNKLADLERGEGQVKLARQYYERSLAICEQLVRLLPQDVQAKRDLGISHERLASLEDQPIEVRLKHSDQAIAIYRQLHQAMPESAAAAGTLVRGLMQRQSLVKESDLEAANRAEAEAHQILTDMRRRGMSLDSDLQNLAERLDQANPTGAP